jgi:large subunit ribosomal protein L4
MTIDAVVRGSVKKERLAPVTRTATRRNVAGHDLGQVDLEPSIFGIEPNQAVLHQVITAQLAAARAGTQSTKTRAEVRGGGAKPFSQKGTGRARQGSSRSPSMSGGGIALGPKPRSYRQHTPKKMVRLALLSALSDRAQLNRIVVLDQWAFESPKTKDAAIALRKLKINSSVLVVVAEGDTVVQKSLANLPNVRTSTFNQLSAHDVIRNDWLLFTDATLPGAPVAATADAPAAADATEEAATDA